MAQGPLLGVRVLELAGLGPAQLGGMLLADVGADVIRVDRPGAGGDRSTEVLSRGRRSIAVDLKDPAGLETVLKLIDWADVLIDPYRPGVVERLGIGPDEALKRNPRLIYTRMTGWGQDGPLAQVAGHDINYIALTGALHTLGAADAVPAPPLNLIGDFGGGGMLMAFAVTAALYERERSGEGQVIDVAMIDGVASLLASIYQLDAGGDWNHQRGTNWLQGAAPWYRAYETSDGRYVTVGPLEPQFYAQLLERLGLSLEEWPQWERWPELAVRMEEIFKSRTLADWTAELEGTDVCFAPALRIDEAPSHPHLAARGVYVEHDGVMQPAPVPRFGRTPGAIGSAPPQPGQNTDEVLRDLE